MARFCGRLLRPQQLQQQRLDRIWCVIVLSNYVAMLMLMIVAVSPASAGIYGNNKGVGLASCSVSHKDLLTSWYYNETTRLIMSMDARTECSDPNNPQPNSCKSAWCLGLDNTAGGLPPGAPGAGVMVTPCDRIPTNNFNVSSCDQAWNLLQDGRLVSLYEGPQNGGGGGGVAGQCLVADVERGVLEMQHCSANATVWHFDAQLDGGRMVASGPGPVVPDYPCLLGVNTSVNVTFDGGKNYNQMESYVDCDTLPGKLLPFCNASIGVEARALNYLSYLYLNEMTSDLSRVGLPNHPPTGECLHGFVSDCLDNNTCLTTFPAASSTASSFNDTLFEAVGAAIAFEGRAIDNIVRSRHGNTTEPGGRQLKPHTICWSPDINPFRHPLWGRGQETPGEDALLCGRYGAAYVRGLQGRDDPEGGGLLRLAAQPKHFLGYDMEGSTFNGVIFNRHNFTANMSAKDMVEYYARPFKHAVMDGGAMGIMCSYSKSTM